MESLFLGLGIMTAIIALGVGVGLGITLGFEIVMRVTGDSRTVLLTWARTRYRQDGDE